MYHKAVDVTIVFQLLRVLTKCVVAGVLSLVLDVQSDSIRGPGVSGSRAGFDGSGYLHELGHCVIEETFIAFAEIAFSIRVVAA